MLIFGVSGLPRGVREPHPKPCVFHMFFWLLGGSGGSSVSIGALPPKHCVFIGRWFLEGPGNCKTLCFLRFSGSSGALGAPIPYVVIETLAPRGPWSSKALCHRFLWASRGAGELQNRMFSQVFGLLGGFGGSKHVFTRDLAPREPWSSKAPCHKFL